MTMSSCFSFLCIATSIALCIAWVSAWNDDVRRPSGNESFFVVSLSPSLLGPEGLPETSQS